MCGMAVLPPGWSHEERALDTMVLILGDQGTLTLEEEGTVLPVAPSHLTLLRADTVHRGLKPTSDKTRYFWLHFKTGPGVRVIPEKEALQILENPEITGSRLGNALLLPGSLKIEGSQRLKDRFQELLNEYEDRSFTALKYQAMTRLLLISINEMVIEAFSSEKKSVRTGLISTMIRHIYEDLGDPGFCVKKLASDLGYNPEYLNRYFKRMMETTLKSYIIEKRIELALRYICETSLSLGEISRKTGFASYRNFVRQFKLRTGRLPGEYRSRYLLMNINH